MNHKISLQIIVPHGKPADLASLLQEKSGLSKAKIKDALSKGALSLKRPHHKTRRLRKAKAKLRPNDILQFFYDPAILALTPIEPGMLFDARRYSFWDKPAGMLSQGSQYGDHCSILRSVELYFKSRRRVFLVHRLDREAEGVICVAHDRQAANLLSKLFSENKVEKTYMVEVKGDLKNMDEPKEISFDINGKLARTTYTQTSYSNETDCSIALVKINSGRLHQIRRHFAAINHPVMGDPRYGVQNKNTHGLRLKSVSLRFTCPFTDKRVSVAVDGLK